MRRPGPRAALALLARQPSLAAVRLGVECRRPWVTVRWTGGALAAG
jgi:hypothetical protein